MSNKTDNSAANSISKHRISTAGVAIRDGRFFMTLRKPGTSIGESWEFPGGKNRIGESTEETLKREFQEELHAEITVLKKIFEGFFTNKGVYYSLHAHEVILHSEESDLFLHEHAEYAWVKREHLQSLPMADSDRQIADYLLQNY